MGKDAKLSDGRKVQAGHATGTFSERVRFSSDELDSGSEQRLGFFVATGSSRFNNLTIISFNDSPYAFVTVVNRSWRVALLNR